jgi:hypothetical protein
MNRDDVIRMAREAGIANSWDLNWQDKIIEAFAKLVAQHEREACAKVCEEQYEYYGHDHVFAKAIRARGQA